MELSFENAQNNFISKEISQVGFLAKGLRDSDEHAGWLSGSAPEINTCERLDVWE